MSTQLRLLDPGRRPEWELDDRTRRIGLRGVAAAREALRRARKPAPVPAASTHLRRAS